MQILHNNLKSIFAMFWTVFLQAVLSTIIMVLKKNIIYSPFFLHKIQFLCT